MRWGQQLERERGGGGRGEEEGPVGGQGEGRAEFSQAAFSLLANYVFKASENFTVRTVRTCCILWCVCVCLSVCI